MGMRSAVVVSAVGLFFVACYNPKLESPGYFCHPEDVPACPDGQRCVNGRCVNGDPGGRPDGSDDLGAGVGDMAGGGDDGGGGSDLGASDMSMMPAPDLAGTMMTLGCVAYTQCLAACSDAACRSACDARRTTQAASKYDAMMNCVKTYCSGNQSHCTGTFGDGTGPGSCQICLDNMITRVTQKACTTQTPNSCDRPSCSTHVDACLALP